MNSKIFWKLLLSAFVLGWSVYYLVPFKETDFKDYLLGHATAQRDELAAVITKAEGQVAEAHKLAATFADAKAAAEAKGETFLPDLTQQEFMNRHRTLFLALRSLGEDDKVDYFQFFPNLKVGATKNIPRRNSLILNHLLKESKSRIKLGLDLQGGVSFTLSVKPSSLAANDEQGREKSMQKVIDIMRRRVDGLGVSEPVIRPVGDNSVVIQLPGVNLKDNPEAVDVLKKPARLEFREVYRGPEPQATPPGQEPMGYVVMTEEVENKNTGEIVEVPHFVSVRRAALGNIVQHARPYQDNSGQYMVLMDFNPEGAKVFEELTKRLVEYNGKIAIILDGKLYSAPAVQGVISSHGQITGQFSQKEVVDLANVLNNPLEEELELDSMNEVGPTLAKEAQDSSIKSALLGTALVVLFMVVIYRFAGFLSVITLGLNILMVLGVQASIGATLTLPGVAALVLTVGMAVDANILIYERMREEMAGGKNLWTSLELGHDRALAAIVDSHFTSIITAVVLMWLGTGPVKGFGVILAIGLAANLFCVLVFNHALLELVIARGWLRHLHFLRLIPETKLPFFSYRKVAIGLSLAVIAVGVGSIFYRGESAMGIDFRGGEEANIKFTQAVPMIEVEEAARAAGIGEIVPSYQKELGTGREMLVVQTETGRAHAFFDALAQAHPDAGLQLLEVKVIGATVSQNLTTNALLALGCSLVGVLIYVAFRFEVGYAIGAIAATLHDVIITVGVYILVGGQFTSSMVAAVLMIIGYSLNDTVIVFDRVREELRLNPQLKLVQVLDLAVNKTLARTTLTSLTTFLAALALFVFGAGPVHEFALVFLIGILTGTTSSIFIANPVFYWWHKGDRKHVESHEVLPKYEWEVSTRAAR